MSRSSITQLIAVPGALTSNEHREENKLPVATVKTERMASSHINPMSAFHAKQSLDRWRGPKAQRVHRNENRLKPIQFASGEGESRREECSILPIKRRLEVGLATIIRQFVAMGWLL